MADKPKVYKGPKPRAYSSLSKADKAKEDRQNEADSKKAFYTKQRKTAEAKHAKGVDTPEYKSLQRKGYEKTGTPNPEPSAGASRDRVPGKSSKSKQPVATLISRTDRLAERSARLAAAAAKSGGGPFAGLGPALGAADRNNAKEGAARMAASKKPTKKVS